MTADRTGRANRRTPRGKPLSIAVFGISGATAVLLRRAARQTLVSRGRRHGHLEISIVNAIEMSRLHDLWKKVRGPTDVLTFDLRERRSRGLVEGEIIVCKDVACKQAAQRDVSLRAELALYVVHGCLHLCGLNDHTASAAARMHRAEDALLVSLGVGPVYYVGDSRK